MHSHACLPCEQRLHFRGMSWKCSLCSPGNACCAYAYKNFSCMISISCFLMHSHACLPCEQRLHFRGMSWKCSLCSPGNACCAYAYKNFSCMISIINGITAYVYYLLQNLLVHWRFLIEFKKYEDERTTILTYKQSCPLLTSYICYNFRHQQRMCHWQRTLLSVHSLPHTNAIFRIFSDSHSACWAFNSFVPLHF